MKDEITINERGTLTIPAAFRKALGLSGTQRMIVEATDEGLLLRPATLVPVELYSDQRIQEFEEEEQAVSKVLSDLEDQ